VTSARARPTGVRRAEAADFGAIAAIAMATGQDERKSALSPALA
jgi:hypothetical protein